MAYWVHILQSPSNGRFYCGHTDDPDRRLRQHNDPEYQSTRTTKIIPGPWTVVLKMECQSRSEAMLLEKKIKKEESNDILNRGRQSPAKSGINHAKSVIRNSSPC